MHSKVGTWRGSEGRPEKCSPGYHFAGSYTKQQNIAHKALLQERGLSTLVKSCLDVSDNYELDSVIQISMVVSVNGRKVVKLRQERSLHVMCSLYYQKLRGSILICAHHQ